MITIFSLQSYKRIVHLFYNTLYLPLLIWCIPEVCIFKSSSLRSRVISILAFWTAISFVLSMAKNNLRSPSGGALPAGKYVPRTVIPASEYSDIWASASFEVTLHLACWGKSLIMSSSSNFWNPAPSLFGSIIFERHGL